MDVTNGLRLLKERLSELQDLTSVQGRPFDQWRAKTLADLRNLFPEGDYADRLEKTWYPRHIGGRYGARDEVLQQDFENQRNDSIGLLEGAIHEITEFWEPASEALATIEIEGDKEPLMDAKPVAFVLMPFDKEFDSVFSGIIVAALTAAGYDVRRADTSFDQKNVLSDIITGISGAQLIVADLTTRNANVMYELGMCHGLRVPTVLIAQSMDDIPFDLRQYRVNVYPTHFARVDEFRSWLQDIGQRHLQGEVHFGSPVVDFLGDEGSPVHVAAPNPLLPQANDSGAQATPEVDTEPKGILDYRVDFEDSMGSMSKVFEKYTTGMEVLGKRVKTGGERLEKLNASDTPGSAAQARKLVISVAHEITSHANNLEESLPELETAVDLYGESVAYLMESVELKTEDDVNEATSLRGLMQDMLLTGNGTQSSLSEYRDTVSELISLGVSRDLNRACRRLVSVQDRVIDSVAKVGLLTEKAIATVDAKLAADARGLSGTVQSTGGSSA